MGNTFIQINAYDKDGIPRVYGYGDTESEARAQCRRALIEYIDSKPWPLEFEDFRLAA